jgi:hypothetical protein
MSDSLADFEALCNRAESYLDAGRKADARELLNQADALLVELEAEDGGRAWIAEHAAEIK